MVTESLARSLIESQFPNLAPAQILLFGEGWDNAAFLVNSDHIFRFPRREIAAPLLVAETQILPLIAPDVPLAVPMPQFLGVPANGYPWHFAGYRRILGRAASEVKLSDEDRSRMAEPLATFLRALHGVQIEAASQRGAAGDEIGRLDMSKRVPLAHEHLARLGHLLECDISRLETILDAVTSDDRPKADTLVHGDLYSRHLLVDQQHNLCGVIDWGDCHIGDRAVDLLPVFTILNPSGRKRFFEIYGPIDDRTTRIAQARALYHTLVVFHYSRDIGDSGLEREANFGLMQLAESR